MWNIPVSLHGHVKLQDGKEALTLLLAYRAEWRNYLEIHLKKLWKVRVFLSQNLKRSNGRRNAYLTFRLLCSKQSDVGLWYVKLFVFAYYFYWLTHHSKRILHVPSLCVMFWRTFSYDVVTSKICSRKLRNVREKIRRRAEKMRWNNVFCINT